MTDAMETAVPEQRPRKADAGERVPMCYFCSSTDTMEPFTRSDHVFLFSTLFPRLRLRYCRFCPRHFLFIASRRGRTPVATGPAPPAGDG